MKIEVCKVPTTYIKFPCGDTLTIRMATDHEDGEDEEDEGVFVSIQGSDYCIPFEAVEAICQALRECCTLRKPAKPAKPATKPTPAKK